MATLDEEYEKKHLQAIQRLQRQVEREYHATIETVFKSAVGLKPRDTFRVAEYPALQQILDREMQRLSESLEGILVNGIESQWELSQTKFGALVDRRYGKEIPTPLKRTVFDANRPALEAFLKRKTNGLDLSQRVWKYMGQFRSELEQGLYLGISEGKPAAKMATEMKQFLKEPDKLFRRVRDAEGNLRLSKAAKAYKPGQGVYRSSYKNALRLTRTETNMAYRSADMERWKRTPFILGHEVRLSNAHPRPDICDSLKGNYPKDFKFTGWHPQCICYTVPILPSAEEYDKYEDAILAGEDKDFQFRGAVQQPPKGFVNYFEQNHKTIAGYKSKPYWVKDNPDFVRIKDGKVVLPEKVQPVKVTTVKPEAPAFTPAKDIKSAEKFFLDNQLAQGKVNYSKIDLETANYINESLFFNKQEFGIVYDKVKVRSGGKANSGRFAVNEVYGDPKTREITGFELFINTDEIIRKETIQKAFKEGHWNSENVRDIINHEFGHRLTKEASRKLTQTEIRNTSFKTSKYSTYNLDESLAEIFVLYRQGKATKEMVEFFNKYSVSKLNL